MHYLYRYYGEAVGLCGHWNLLYIGITSRTPEQRDAEHVHNNWWWRQHAKHFRPWWMFETETEALIAEEKAIRKYQPLYNKTHNERFAQSERGIILLSMNLFLSKIIVQRGRIFTVEMIRQQPTKNYPNNLRDNRVKYLNITTQGQRDNPSRSWALRWSDGKKFGTRMHLGPCDLTNRDDLKIMPKVGQPLTPTEAVRLARAKLPEFEKIIQKKKSEIK